MGLKTWIRNFLSDGTMTKSPMTEDEFFNLVAELHIRELAFWSAVNMIANSISKCEFKMFIEGKEVKDKEYYLWNVSPNKNQNSSSFLQKLITQLYLKNECLVIEKNGQFLVADSFQQKQYALKDNEFTNVTVGDLTFHQVFYMSDVMYFHLSQKDMRKVTNALFESYGKLIAYAEKSYQKSRGSRGILNYETFSQGNLDAKKIFDDLMNERFKKFFNSENAVLPLPKGYSYDDIGSKTYNNETTRDIRAMIDDVADFTAKAFNIPPALAKGDIAGIKDAMDSYLTFCIDPLADMLQEEINRKRGSYELFAKGTYMAIDTKCILHVDLLSVSSAIDKLIASGAFCINDIRKLVGETEIDEDWAKKHFITKNYSDIEQALQALQEQKGGETN